VPVGVPEVVAGITVEEADDADEDPAAFIATTVKVYEVPFVKPVKVQEVLRVLVHPAGALTDGDEVTV
jgi:acyl dehydratase